MLINPIELERRLNETQDGVAYANSTNEINPKFHVELISATKYYGRRTPGAVVLVNGQPHHDANARDARKWMENFKARHCSEDASQDAPAGLVGGPDMGESRETEYDYKGKTYHFNKETNRWHDADGEPVMNSGIDDALNNMAAQTADEAANHRELRYKGKVYRKEQGIWMDDQESPVDEPLASNLDAEDQYNWSGKAAPEPKPFQEPRKVKCRNCGGLGCEQCGGTGTELLPRSEEVRESPSVQAKRHTVSAPLRISTGEYIVKWMTDGKRDERKTYYTDSLDDAEETCKYMRQQADDMNAGKKLKEADETEDSATDNVGGLPGNPVTSEPEQKGTAPEPLPGVAGKSTEQTIVFKVSGHGPELKAFEKLLGWINFCGMSGHGAVAEVSVDGDGSGKLRIELEGEDKKFREVEAGEDVKAASQHGGEGPELKVSIGE